MGSFSGCGIDPGMTAALSLETARLRLRRLTLDDAGLMLAIWNDPAFVRYVGDRGIRSIEAARTELEAGALKLYEDYGYGPYRIDLRPSDTPIGICGLFHRDGLDAADIGYALLPSHCGKGYACEAAAAVVEHARSDLGMQHLIAIISPDNVRSIGLIEKLGLRFERMHRMHDDDDEVCIYGLHWSE